MKCLEKQAGASKNKKRNFIETFGVVDKKFGITEFWD